MKDFSKMDRKEKAEYINSNLSQGTSFKEIYEATMHNSELARSKEALLNQFKKAGYRVNQSSNYENIKAPGNSTDNTCQTALRNDTKIESLIAASDDILQMLAWWKNNHDNSSIDDWLNIEIPHDGEDVRKSLRINMKVWNEWKAFCSKNSGFSEKDLLAKALLFYMKQQ
jgi:hypothetical protein